ncbi:MAG: Bacterial regulatory protein lacI family, partial [Reyranella sp.]|nr:Bacterial regulatory protein lacI family [Reyranella sp.]
MTSVVPTLMAVARRAGVSPMTVSRVVRRLDMVSEDTRLSVETAMR